VHSFTGLLPRTYAPFLFYPFCGFEPAPSRSQIKGQTLAQRKSPLVGGFRFIRNRESPYTASFSAFYRFRIDVGAGG